MIKGDIIQLTQVSKEDVSIINLLRNDWDLKKLTLGIRFPISMESDIAWYNHISSDHTNKNIFFSIKTIEDDSFAGLLQINNIDWINRNAMIGVQLIVEAKGKGLGYEAISLGKKYCFDIINLKKISAQIASYNSASIKLFEKSSFELEAKLKKHIFYDNKYFDLLIYSIIND